MNSPGFIVHLTFCFLGILPAIFVLFSFKDKRPKYHKLWMYAFVLIALGSVIAAIGYDLLYLIEQYVKLGKPDQYLAEETKLHVSLWVYVFPGITIALGVNLLTEFLLKDPVES